ncbi:MAG: hypothetical protein Q9191_000605 [Dirinaria sp. TL-2023a]
MHRQRASNPPPRDTAREANLIEFRAHKMPYKHIAAQLKKTELACRLHYHQLSFGGKRRRRATSVSSAVSVDSRASVPPLDHTRESTPQRQLPGHFPPQSPDESAKSYESTSRSPYAHVPILPKPLPATQRVAEQSRSLRLITENINGFPSKQHIDMERLDKIYDAHRIHFWSMIARSYGCNLAPAVLEDAWRRAHCVSGGNFPPTPGTSPQNTTATILSAPFTAGAELTKHFTPIGSGASGLARSAIERNHQSGLAISSLLTENKEVRSSPEGKKFSFSYDTRHYG